VGIQLSILPKCDTWLFEKVLQWVGGKRSELKQLCGLLPHTFDKYIEPFFGGGALFFVLPQTNAILNDLDHRLMSFYRCMQTNYISVTEHIEILADEFNKLLIYPPEQQLPLKKEYYKKIRDLYNDGYEKKIESAEQAARYFFLNHTSFGAIMRINKQNKLVSTFGHSGRNFRFTVTEEQQKKLSNAWLLCGDYKYALNLSTSRDFIFLDLPYHNCLNEYSNTTRHADGFAEDSHKRLASDFRNLICPALMIIAETPFIRGLYSDFIKGEYEKTYNIKKCSEETNKVTHLIIKNY
jgi:DNA adenine methylase